MTKPTQQKITEIHTQICELVFANHSVANLRMNVNTFVTERGEKLVKKISELCKQRGISLAQLERECGLKSRTVYRWDANVPSVDKVKAVADYLGVTVDSLIKNEE